MKIKRLLTYTLLILNIIAATLLLISYIAAFIDPQKIWIFAFLGISYPIILIVNLFFMGMWLLMWKKYFFISLLTILLGWQNLKAIYPFKFHDIPSVPANQGIKILSYNVHGFYGLDDKRPQTEVRKEITGFIIREKPDILFCQEFLLRGEIVDTVLKFYAGKISLKYYSYKNYDASPSKKRINAIIIFSRYPILKTGYFQTPGKNVHGLYADILAEKDTVRLYNLHLASIRFGAKDYSFYSHLTDPENEPEGEPLKEGSKRMLWKLRKAFITRSIQVNNLMNELKSCRFPVILGGDFNDTPYSYTYHQITQKFTDAFIESGDGIFESTYSGKLPSYRIDYIMYSSSFTSTHYQTSNIIFSDHYPVSAVIYLKTQKN